MRPAVLGFGLVVLFGVVSCGGGSTVPIPEVSLTMHLTSEAFADGEMIPIRYTCDGENRSPSLAWSDVPDGTRELALLVDDPDAPRGLFVHWVVWGLDPSTPGLAEGGVPATAHQGRNGFGDRRWGGPCPPRGDDAHRYVFTLFALSQPLDLRTGASADDFKRALGTNVLAEGRLTGRYRRAR